MSESIVDTGGSRADPASALPPGRLSFGEELFRAIVGRVLEGTEGARLGNRARGGLIQRIRRRLSEGLSVEVQSDRVSYRIPVIVRADGDVRAVCREVQRRVARETHRMTGLEKVEVNVSIRGIE